MHVPNANKHPFLFSFLFSMKFLVTENNPPDFLTKTMQHEEFF
jgi:hypothetical protein